MDLEKLEALAKAATPGPWRGDRTDGTVKYDIVAGDYPSGKYETVCRGDNGNNFGFMKAEDEDYALAANPAAILALIAEVRALRSEVELLSATQAACDSGSCEHDGCQRQDLTGYRDTARIWVTEYHTMKQRLADAEDDAQRLHADKMDLFMKFVVGGMEKDAERYRRLKSFAHPSYNIETMSNAGITSLAKEEFITVHAGTWEAMDYVLDGVVTVNTVNIKEQS